MKIMIVDDEKLSADALAVGLDWKDAGFEEVCVCYDAMQAWTILKEGGVDLLLCDIEMPLMGGLDLQKKIVDAQLSTRTILLTCHADFSYARQALRLGVTDYLLKPVGETELRDVVNRTIEEIKPVKRGKKLEASSALPPALQDACRYIEEHLGEEIGRDDVARAVFLNPDYLNRIFKKELNMSLSHFILKKKMQQACRMLCETDLSVSEISERVGYTNFSAFSYAFRRSVGCSPTGFRRK